MPKLMSLSFHVTFSGNKKEVCTVTTVIHADAVSASSTKNPSAARRYLDIKVSEHRILHKLISVHARPACQHVSR